MTGLKIILTGILFCPLIQAFSQHTLTGVVTDKKTGEPLTGANIFSKTDWKYGTTTQVDGSFILQIPEKLLTDSVVISFIGYRDKLVAVKILQTQPPVHIALDELMHEVEEAVVVARRVISEEFTVESMKKLDIYLSASSKADPLLAVGSMVSSTTTDESANISLRGSTPAETGIYFNHVPVYDAVRFSQLNGIGTFSIFNTAIVKNMHVFPGNPPLSYGDATSGLIAIESDEELPPESSYGITASLASFGGIMSRKAGKKAGITVFGNYQPSGAIIALNPVALSDLKHFTTSDLGLHMVYKASDRLIFKLFNYSNIEGYTYRFRHPSAEGNYDMEKIRNFTILNIRKNYQHSELSFDHGNNFSKANYRFNNMDMNVFNMDLFYAAGYLWFNDKWSFQTGFSVSQRESAIKGKVAAFDWALAPNHPSWYLDTTYSVIEPELYIYIKYKILPSLTTGAGIRRNEPVDKTKGFTSYQFNIHYDFTKNQGITVSAGEYHKNQLPGEGLHEVYLFNSQQLSADYSFSNRIWEVKTSVFVKKTQEAISKYQAWGYELFGKYRINEKIEATVSFTHMKIDRKQGDIKLKSEYDLEYYLRSSLKYRFLTHWEMNAVAIYRQGCWYRPVEGAEWIDGINAFRPIYTEIPVYKRLPDYSRVDLSISHYWPVSESLTIISFANASNVFNHRNARIVNYNADYSEQFYESFSQQTFYFGFVLNF